MSDHRDIKAQQFEHDLIHRALADARFRLELTANPTAVLRRELTRVGGTIADDVTVHVIEETPQHVYIVLPPRGHLGGSYDPYKIGRV